MAAADKVPYDEPPVFFYPVRESLGAALLLSGKAQEAERVFREDLVRHPRNPRSLFGLHESLAKQNKAERGRRVGDARVRRGVEGRGHRPPHRSAVIPALIKSGKRSDYDSLIAALTAPTIRSRS